MNWPGLPTRTYLSGGLTLTADERHEAKTLLASLKAVVEGEPGEDTKKARFALISKMLLAYPTSAAATRETGKARGELYLESLDDVAPWAIDDVIKRWGKGNCGLDEEDRPHNYDFAPSPARLRKLARKATEGFSKPIAHLEALLNAVPLDRAMDPAPMKGEGGEEDNIAPFRFASR